MLSAKVGELCAQILELNKQLDELVLEETAGKYGICRTDWIQLWADPDMHHDLQELEEFVGNVHITHKAPDKTEHYRFTLGGARCSIIMRLQEMPDFVLYELYDVLDCLKTLDSAAAMIIYKDLMSQHKEQVIDAMQLVIIEVISNRR